MPITIATLYEAKVAPLIDAANSRAKKDGQADRVPGIIQGRIDHIRRKIASCKRNRLDTDVTAIPTGLKDIAVTLIIEKLKISIEQELSQDERASVSRAETDLNRIASGDDVIEQPDNPLPSYQEMQVSQGVTAKAGQRRATREKMEGL
ncbi:MAG: hypothetical protein WCH99_04840 [Verrucomicrobiota bacterium]